MSISSQNYEKYFIVAKIISKINSKTLTYMLYQRISFICPYIIPFIYTQRDFPDKETLKKGKVSYKMIHVLKMLIID